MEPSSSSAPLFLSPPLTYRPQNLRKIPQVQSRRYLRLPPGKALTLNFFSWKVYPSYNNSWVPVKVFVNFSDRVCNYDLQALMPPDPA